MRKLIQEKIDADKCVATETRGECSCSFCNDHSNAYFAICGMPSHGKKEGFICEVMKVAGQSREVAEVHVDALEDIGEISFNKESDNEDSK